MDREKIKNRFTYHSPKEGQPEIYVKIRSSCLDVAMLFNDLCPDSPELEKAIDKLEQAVFYANASIARN